MEDLSRTEPLDGSGREPWRTQAACRGVDPDIFHPASEEEAAAKSICAECSVREPCLEFAIATRQPDGVWGGTTERERRNITRRRRRASSRAGQMAVGE
jgi:WhiB family redox-sensing transcriptional regulator